MLQKRKRPPNGPRCPGDPARGVGCLYVLKAGETHCFNHDPRRAAERSANARKARSRKPGDLGTELGTYDGLARRAAEVLRKLEKGKVEPKEGTAQITALRFLAALVRARQVEPTKGAVEAMGAAAAGSIESLIG